MIKPTSGSVILGGVELTTCRAGALRRERTRLQMIFQDPISSLNPRRRVRDIVAEPLDIWHSAKGAERTRIVNEMLEAVGLDPEDRRAAATRGNFSGGQCQRISIARALVMRPQVLICDEMVSALDVSVQAQILNLVEDLKASYGLTVLFIAHDLAVVKNVSDRVAVMYLGRLCEVATAEELYRSPRHPYTNALLGLGGRARPRPRRATTPRSRASRRARWPRRRAAGSARGARTPRTRCADRGARAARARARATTSPATSPSPPARP